MKRKNESILSLLMFQIIAGGGLVEEWIWSQMPLRTAAMHDAGLPGGDGFQQVYGLSFAPSDPSRVYASIDCAQVWRSDDGGWSWKRASRGFRAIGGMSLAVDPLDRDVVFVAAGQARPEAVEVDGVYRTLDGGDSWERVLPAGFYKLDGPRGGSVFWIDPGSESGGRCQTIYVADQQGEKIFRSGDGGTSWTDTGVSGLGLMYDFQRNPLVDEFWISTDSGLYRMEKNDATYSKRRVDSDAEGLPSGTDNAVTRILIHTLDSNIIYALCGTAGFYKSTDGGETFHARNQGIPSNIAGKKEVSMLDMNPLDPDWLVLSHFETAYGNFMSFDGGETWNGFENLDSTGLMDDLDSEGRKNSFYVGRKVAFHPADPGSALIPGSMWEMQRTIDGGQSWQFSGNGFCGARVGVGRTSFAFPASRPEEITLFIIDYGPFRSTDGGETFRTLAPVRVDGARTSPVGAVHPQNPDIVICPSGHWNRQQLIKTTNGGTSWGVVDDEPGNFRFCAFHPQDPAVVYAGDRRSDDGGGTWIRLDRPVVEMYPANGSIVFSYDVDNGWSRFYRSDDQGESWEPLGEAIPVSNLGEVTVDPSDPERLYVPTGGRGLYILDHGAWDLRDETTGLPRDWFGDYRFRNMAVHPGNTDILYLSRLNSQKGHTDGIFRSGDRGRTWENITAGLGPELTVWAIGVDARHDRVYIGTSSGTWYSKGGAGILLAGWDGAMNTSRNRTRSADLVASGVSARVILSDDGTPGSHWTGSWAGSSDGSFGSRTRAGARVSSTVETGAFFENTTGAWMDFELTHHGEFAYEVREFRFDAWRTFNGASAGYRLSLISGDPDETNLISAGTFMVQGANPEPLMSD